MDKEATTEEQIKAVYALCTKNNSYENSSHFVKAILVYGKVIENLLSENEVGDYKVRIYNGNDSIKEFLGYNPNFSGDKKQKSNLLIFKTENSNLLSKMIWTLRCLEGVTKRKWLINQSHWDGSWSELKQNLWDVTMDFTGEFGKNYVKRMIANDW
jgi:hypothetical protein